LIHEQTPREEQFRTGNGEQMLLVIDARCHSRFRA
jgi:hypothetical protein